ncbi:MAG TPA: alanine--glyoxylate aminotransferase family protein [Planctomycetota bacterium]|nr:alanine--glyoxylate aminotransferase family protein [Planctomycetota bacterium]
MKERLMTPGPAEVPPETLLELAKPVFHHRTKEFRATLMAVTQGLKDIFRTKNDVFIFTSSGTGAMEASVSNLLAPGDKALCVRGGKFGERWGELCERFGAMAIHLDVEWGQAVEPAAIGAALAKDPDIAAVYVTLCETSTGVATDVEAIGKIVAGTGACLVVDGISGVGAMPMETDAWGVDLLVVGSQKALLLPPGLAFLSVSPKAWARVEKAPRRSYYFDLIAAREALAAEDTPYTPANTLVAALRKSLDLLRKEGIEAVWARHAKTAAATRAAVEAMGLRVYAAAPADALTAVALPEGMDAEAVRSLLKKKYGVAVAGGQGNLKGKIIRIGHLGYVDTLDTLGALAALEMVLAEMGAKVAPGAGVAAAQKVLLAK